MHMVLHFMMAPECYGWIMSDHIVCFLPVISSYGTERSQATIAH